MDHLPTAGATPVVIVTQERTRRRGLLWLAGGATAVLLAGGSTFALWSANASFGGGTITAGDLNLELSSDTAFYDVSDDRTDATATVTGTDGSTKGHAITSISTWRMVPGDEVAASFSAELTLSGDNLVGRLSVEGLDDLVSTNTSLTYTYEIYQAGATVVSRSALPADGTLLYVSAPATGQASGLEDATISAADLPVTGTVAATSVLPMASTVEDVTVVVYASFDAEAGDAGAADVDADGVFTDQTTGADGTRQDATAADTLGRMLLRLDQVRDTGAVFS